jgi:kynurenine formamidase
MVRAVLPLLIVAGLVACEAQDPPAEERPGMPAGLDPSRVIDLTHALSASMPFWPGPDRNPFVHDTLRAHESGAPAMAAFSTPEHHGTHLDAPVHGGDGLASVDQLRAADLFGPAVVVDVRAHVAENSDYAATVDDLTAWESRNGPIPRGAVVLLRTGWDAQWSEPHSYMRVDEQGRLHFPGFSTEAARFLRDEREIRGIGVDSPSVDPGSVEGFPVHGVINGAGKYQLENLTRLDRLPEAGAFLIVAPVKIEGGSGGPVRVFALLP